MIKFKSVLPYFQGFYNSIHLSQSDLEIDLENCDETELKEYYPKEFKEFTENYSEEFKKAVYPTFKGFLISNGDYTTYRGLSYQEAMNKVSLNCVNELEGIIKEALDHLKIDLGNFSFEFEKVDSPREYNFCTDRIFFDIVIQDTDKFIEGIKLISELPKLDEIVTRSFTNRDGFISHYSNDIIDWIDSINNRPLDLDHNELETLLKTLIESYIKPSELEEFLSYIYSEANEF